jgi:hypothetical protein
VLLHRRRVRVLLVLLDRRVLLGHKAPLVLKDPLGRLVRRVRRVTLVPLGLLDRWDRRVSLARRDQSDHRVLLAPLVRLGRRVTLVRQDLPGLLDRASTSTSSRTTASR